MGIASFRTSGSFNNIERYLNRAQRSDIASLLEQYGQQGVSALEAATPVNSGLAANSWYYVVTRTRSGVSIRWMNSDVENGFPVAIMIQYGYSTGTGGYVQGRDYINPAIRPIFDEIDQAIAKVVSGA